MLIPIVKNNKTIVPIFDIDPFYVYESVYPTTIEFGLPKFLL